jgi:hypothetical protein
MVDTVKLREAFAAFLGEKRFRAFVRQLAGPQKPTEQVHA